MSFLPAFTETLGGKSVICYLEATRLQETCADELSARAFVQKSFADGLEKSVGELVAKFGEVDWFIAFFWMDEETYHPKIPPMPMVDLWSFRLKEKAELSLIHI